MTTTTTTMYATRDFTDAGTERAFSRGETLKDVTEGEMANYVAAGLASATKPKAEDTTTETKGATKAA